MLACGFGGEVPAAESGLRKPSALGFPTLLNSEPQPRTFGSAKLRERFFFLALALHRTSHKGGCLGGRGGNASPGLFASKVANVMETLEADARNPKPRSLEIERDREGLSSSP